MQTLSVWTFGLLLFLGEVVYAQHIPYPTYQGDGDNLIRLSLLAGDPAPALNVGPLTYVQVDSMLRRIDRNGKVLSRQELWAYNQAAARVGRVDRIVSADAGWWGRNFYTKRGYGYFLGNEDFKLYVNPVLDLRLGTQNNTAEPSGIIIQNTRGLTVRGEVDGKVWFSTTLYENQARLPSYEREWRRAYNNQVPGVGFFKRYTPILWEASDAVDYFQSFAEVGFKLSKHIAFQFGHELPRVGPGYRSLLINDFADPYLYAQIDTRVGRIHYRNLFASLKDGPQTSTRLSRKFMASHTISFTLTPTWEVGLTEIIVSSRENGVDAQYFNPVILYRAIEQDNGSPDNSIVAFHSSLAINKHLFVYGQFLLDEFKFDRLFGGEGWWANKYSWQLGGRWLDPFNLTGLELGAEYNLVRPFTYGHRFPKIAFTHYDQPMAHPWGADLSEAQARIRYQTGKWSLSARVLGGVQSSLGLATDTLHQGANVLINNNLREQDFGYGLADRQAVRRLFTEARITFHPIPGAQFYVQWMQYDRTSLTNRQQGVMFGLSLNAIRRSTVF